jgi:kynurenine formamidase
VPRQEGGIPSTYRADQNGLMTSYRARVDARVSFTNGGSLTVQGFLLDVDGPAAGREEIGQLLLASLGLLMAGEVAIDASEIVEQPHKGTRGGPSDRSSGAAQSTGRLVDLNHVIREGMLTYPGLPAPSITPFLTRSDSRARYAEGVEFTMECMTLIGNTGTYLDSPHHRYEGGTDLSGIELADLVNLPAVVVRVTDSAVRGVDAQTLAAIDPAAIAGAAVLLHTGNDVRFGTPEYAIDAAYLARDGAEYLVSHGATLVGIDSVNIDEISDMTRPAHSILLGGGVQVVEHLTGLEQLPPFGARFSAVPPRFANFGTFPVRAFATL